MGPVASADSGGDQGQSRPATCGQSPRSGVSSIGRFWAGDFKLWLSVWERPRETVRRILAFDSQMHVALLCCLGGMEQVLQVAQSGNWGDRLAVSAIAAVVLVAGPLLGLFAVWINSHLLKLTGRWLGGRGSREQLGTALAWGCVPVVLALLLFLPKLLIGGTELFTRDTPRLEQRPVAVFWLVLITTVEQCARGYTYYLLCQTVTEVQGYRSAWTGLVNLLLTSLIWIVLGLALVWLLGKLGPRAW